MSPLAQDESTYRDHKTAFLHPEGPSLRTGTGRVSRSLPPDLVRAAKGRLEGMVLIYAMIFLAANGAPYVGAGQLSLLFADAHRWLPAAVSIGVSFLFWGWLRWSRSAQDTSRMINLGLAWLVLACYGIAFAEYWWLPPALAKPGAEPIGVGLSWVALFVMAYVVTVPSPALRTLIATLCAGTSVPVTIWGASAWWGVALPWSATRVFFEFAFPYVLVALAAGHSARTIYHLGREVRRAREMGSYRLEHRMGMGGMGEVWLARHRMLARPAAVKLIRIEALQGDAETADHAERRFEREAMATAMLRSPHTVELYDYGKSNDGALYYVMELLDGLDFDAVVRRFGPLPPERVIHLIVQACASLDDAHRHGMLHRDIKPSNLFLARLGTSYDFVKVMDFGLVKSVRSDPHGEATQLTGDGVTAGTPAYMSPEAITRDHPVDHRTDLYTLGCVTYWLLTGTPVFDGSSSMKMLIQHANEQPVAPSSRLRSRLSPRLQSMSQPVEIPRPLDRVVLSCLAKHPDERPQSAGELAAALASVDLPSPWTPERASKWWAEHIPEDQPEPA